MPFAHSEAGPLGLVGFIAIAVITLYWLVHYNRRIDATEDPMTENPTKRSAFFVYGLICCAVVTLAIVGFVVWNTQRHSVISAPQIVVDDLCLASKQAVTDPDTALDTFNGSPHNALHKLETDLRTEDPAAALRMKKAKAAAEKALKDGAPDASALTATLAAETAEAYQVLDPGATINTCA
ncbi:unannotated protein [freshwater metagenome]|uniref:Unannotated protein n=1 Tax=freshwater metagenome TaxID=449393 RepID=A0A6J6C7X3_9ZZZZ|nr:hypothetical protein [Actinomycetota bacterium]MTA87871.1 hypothetical protein [Actinomycetota bacterium]MTB01617.1 hypothetical protein [Actinomycetota bacterium]